MSVRNRAPEKCDVDSSAQRDKEMTVRHRREHLWGGLPIVALLGLGLLFFFPKYPLYILGGCVVIALALFSATRDPVRQTGSTRQPFEPL